MKDFLLLWRYRLNQFRRLCYFSVKNYWRVIKNFFVTYYMDVKYYVLNYYEVKKLHKYFRYRIYSKTLYKFIEKEKNAIILSNFKNFCIENNYLQNIYFEGWLIKGFVTESGFSDLENISLIELQKAIEKVIVLKTYRSNIITLGRSFLSAESNKLEIVIYNTSFTYNIELLRAEILDRCLTLLGHDLTTKYLNTIIEKITQVYISIDDFTEQLHERVLNNTDVMCELINQHEQNFYKSYRPDLTDGVDPLIIETLDKISKILNVDKILNLEKFSLLQDKEN